MSTGIAVPKTRAEYDAAIKELLTRGPADVLARTIWGEARGEGKKTPTLKDDWRAMVFVGGVIMRRAAKPSWWGRNIVQVCLKEWQFSVWNFNDPNLGKLLTINEGDAEYCLALGIAFGLVNEHIDYMPITNGADHYHTKAINPTWASGGALARVSEVGEHIGYA